MVTALVLPEPEEPELELPEVVEPEEFDPETPPHEMACYPPEADFVIRSAAHPEREVRDWRQFEALRRSAENARKARQTPDDTLPTRS